MIPNYILQMCDPNKNFVDRLTDFQFWEALTCQYADPIGFYVLGVLVYSGVALPIYIRTGSIGIPAVLLLIVGGLVLPQVAGIASGYVLIVTVLAIGGSITYLIYRFA